MKTKSFFTICFICLLCFTGLRLKAWEKIDGDFYKQNYGVVTKDQNPKVKLAESIFKKIYQASALERSARLIILPRQAEKWKKWISVLADGSVVMVESALELCFKTEKNSDVSKSCLAFILGHELAHLINDDHLKKLYSHKLSFMFGKTEKTMYTPRQRREFENIEEQADFRGLTLMTMAGFNPAHISRENSFFRQYQDKIGKRRLIIDETYPNPDERAQRLQNKISRMIDNVDLFYQGLAKYRQGLYSEAIDLFKSFARHFNSREVWNNIGLSYYQWAMKDLALLDKKQLMKFRLSTIVASETLASKLIYKGKIVTSEQEVQNKLNEAEEAFRQAITLDSDYLPAKINLSSVLISLKQYDKALKEVEAALELSSNNLAVLLNKAVALYLSGSEKHWAEAQKILKLGIPLSSPYYSQALYNYNVIREEQLQCAAKSWEEKEKVCKPLWSGFFRLEPNTNYSKLVENRYKYKERRIALVIGNSNYPKAYLHTSLRDAVGVASALHELGFEVHLRQNVDKEEMKKAIWSFGKRIQQGGVGLFYYSGHGVQIEGKDYLIPIGANVVASRQAELEFVRMDEALVQMEAADNFLNVVILDACRNNPFSGFKGAGQGLAGNDRAPKGAIIGYATAPGGVAIGVSEDGYSPYTKGLLEYMKKPGLKIEDMFKKVRQSVVKKTSGLQTPWETTSLEGDFYFNPSVKGKTKPVAANQVDTQIAADQDNKLQNDYSWIWHTTAISLTAGALYTVYQSDRKFERLDQRNHDLRENCDNHRLSTGDKALIEDEHNKNEQEMENLQSRSLVAGSVALAAIAWELYLIFKNNDKSHSPENINRELERSKYAVTSDLSGNIKLTFNWLF